MTFILKKGLVVKMIFLYQTDQHLKYLFYDKGTSNIIEVEDPNYNNIFSNKKIKLILYISMVLGIIIGYFVGSYVNKNIIMTILSIGVLSGIIFGIYYGIKDREKINVALCCNEKKNVIIARETLMNTLSLLVKHLIKQLVICFIVLFFLILNSIVYKNVGFIIPIFFSSVNFGTNLIAFFQFLKNKRELNDCWK